MLNLLLRILWRKVCINHLTIYLDSKRDQCASTQTKHTVNNNTSHNPFSLCKSQKTIGTNTETNQYDTQVLFRQLEEEQQFRAHMTQKVTDLKQHLSQAYKSIDELKADRRILLK
jgi:hypothetical protein